MNSEELYFLNNKKTNPKDEVIIEFGIFNGLDKIHELDIKLHENIPEELGHYDGHEIAIDDSHGRLFAYGDNAEDLFKVMQPILKEFDFLNKANVYLRFIKEDETSSELEFKLNEE